MVRFYGDAFTGPGSWICIAHAICFHRSSRLPSRSETIKKKVKIDKAEAGWEKGCEAGEAGRRRARVGVFKQA